MTWLASLGVGLLTAIVGLVGTGLLAMGCVEWFRVSAREGAAGYFIVILALIGAAAGGVIGVIVARVMAAGPSPAFLKTAGCAAGSVVGLLALIALVCWLVADLRPRRNGHPIKIHAELRCPRTVAIPAQSTKRDWYARIDTRSRVMTDQSKLNFEAARQEEGRWIIPVTMDLSTSRREKLFYVFIDKAQELFVLRFSAKDSERYREWSAWQDGGWTVGQPQPPAEQRFNLRYRLEEDRPAPKPDALTEQATRDKQAAEENAALAALTPDSSLEHALKLVHRVTSEERRNRAGALIAQRPEFVAELSQAILEDSDDLTSLALRAVPFLQPIPPELAAPVGQVGDDLVARLEKVVATPEAEDPTYQGAADFYVKFAPWFAAHRALHEAGLIDGRPQLQKIRTLGQRRTEIYALRENVLSTISHYFNAWDAKAAR